MNRLAIVSTHPIQYNAPLFKLLGQQSNITIKVFYTLGNYVQNNIDRGFGKKIDWDIPLLDGYDYCFLKNTAKQPSTGSFKGIVNPSAIEEINAFGPTAILVYGWSFRSHLKILRYYKGRVPVYFRGDSTLLDEAPGVRTALRRIILRWVYIHIDKAFYVGTHNKAYFLKHGVAPEKLVFAPHAIDNTRFADDDRHAEQSSALRHELGLTSQDKVFLFIGKFEPKKNPILLIRAFKLLNDPNAILVMVGNGILEGEIKKEAIGCEQIKFLPFQNQSKMPAIYRIADILVLPSQGPGETWGLCVNEAMASGLAIIASNKVGCAVDLVDTGLNGYIFQSGHEKSLFEYLKVFCSKSHDEIYDMKTSSREIIKNWDYKTICDAYLNALDV